MQGRRRQFKRGENAIEIETVAPADDNVNSVYEYLIGGEEPWASKLKAAPDELIPMFRREDIHVAVVGGETNGYWRIMGANYQKTVSIDEWR